MYKYLIIISLFFVQQCSTTNNKKELAFYYWKTNFQFDKNETETAKKLGVDKLYIRFFDVDWSEMQQQAIPLGELYVDYKALPPDTFVPCVFITNTTIRKCSKESLEDLAGNIVAKIKNIAKDIDYRVKHKKYEYPNIPDSTIVTWNQVQIDCDWTPKTKDKYFFFLTKIKEKLSNKEISSTLRLWQLKHKDKAGIPPVDRVMLMCYSTGNPKEYNISNSLATYEDIASYIKGSNYPLNMDIALPIFNWAVLFRNQNFKGLLRTISPEVIKTDTSNYQLIKDNRYYFKSDTVIANTYIRYGDEIRLESLSSDDLSKLVKLLKNEDICSDNSTVSFFSWDTTYINNYSHEFIKSNYRNLISN